jgi:ligand-binding sensor domain-containing protein/class 3 adenylate cyclase
VKRITTVLFLFVLLLACNTKNKKQRSSFAPKVVEAHGYIVPKDSMASPKVILVDESKLTKVPVGKAKIVPTNTNVHPAGQGKVVMVDKTKLRIITPGTYTFSLPKIVPAIDSPFAAGIPEVTLAKDPHINDNNPESFSSFSKLQGLQYANISCILEDKSGNLWFGTTGGGVSKYDGQRFTHFTDKEGLSHNFVRCILEDKFGNIWFGTAGGGVSKYDGQRFTNFTEKQGLSNNVVLSILEDKSGNLWFGTEGGGVSKYDGQRFTHFTNKQGLNHNDVSSILEDKSGNLWFGTDGGGVSKYDGQRFTHFTEQQGLSNNLICSILEDKSGNLWFGAWGGGVTKYDGQRFTQFTDQQGLSHNDVYCILEDKSGNLWFGTWGGGVTKYDGQSFTHFTDQQGLSNNVVLSILEDKSGNLWFGTNGGGVSKYDGQRFTHFTDQQGLCNNVVLSVLKDKSGNLWFGTWGGGVSKYDGQRFTHFTDKQGLSHNDVRSILEDKSGNIWFGTRGGGVSKYDGQRFTHFTDKQGLGHNDVRSILEDKFGNLWFGTAGGGVSKYDGQSFTQFTDQQGLSNNDVYRILEDKSGNLWFGTGGGGVSKYDGQRFTHFTNKQGLSHNDVRSILEDKSGNLWFGTNGGGVSKYDGQRFTHFNEQQGLSNNFVLSILEDKSGNLWFGTRFGLAKLSMSRLVFISDKANFGKIDEDPILFKTYLYEDGFYGVGCNSNSICQTKDGTIWIGANDRLTAFHPKGDETDTLPPNIQLTSIALFNENIPWAKLENKKDTSILLGNSMSVGDFEFDGITKWYGLPEHLSLAYNNNYLTFSFIGITQKQSKKVKYLYKLEGLDENWSALTYRTEAAYGNLTQGTYTFKVKAMNSEGFWSKPFEYTFTIRPPWWKTWWAYGLYFISTISSALYYIKWREKALKQRQAELENTVEKRTAEVVAEKKEVEKQKVVVEKEKKRSDDLLLNILPQEVADELKEKGSAEARLIDEVTILFTDFKGFTQLSDKLTPKELVGEINECFSAFDHIMGKFGVEKIKTIGDAYMAAGGLPTSNTTHAIDVLNAAIDIQQYMHEQNLKKAAEGKLFFEIRIGVHSGPVVAGIVGVKKFAYDIWGDTVNTASRMESSGEVGKINISGATYELIKDKINCTYRGKIFAKGKGEIDMYFVESIL